MNEPDEFDEINIDVSENDDDDLEYNSIYNDDEIEDDLNSDDDDELPDEVLPENDFSKFDIVSNTQVYIENEKSKKKFHPFLTNFEKIKILALRAQQIEDSSPVLVNVPEHISSSKDIAQLEYDQKKIPFMIRRYLSNTDYYEDWKLEEFENYP